MRRLTRFLVALAIGTTALMWVGGAPPAGALPPPATCTAAVTGDGAAQCLFMVVPLTPAAAVGGFTLTVAAGEIAAATLHCTVGTFALVVVGPGFSPSPPLPRAGLCVVEVVGTGVGWATAVGF
ncbi:MAG: hypothetical protein QOK43_2727 [Acidimicrobiaceae bacterium]|nr:hypothetical protein [Acidimicrobiaceae bacterium]MDQ1445095.1 hypothetical protein [Acidimicrobiaceae bacterium]